MEMCVVKVAHALDTCFAALIAAEAKWAKSVGRTYSQSGGGDDDDAVAAAAAAAMDMVGIIGDVDSWSESWDEGRYGSFGGGGGGEVRVISI